MEARNLTVVLLQPPRVQFHNKTWWPSPSMQASVPVKELLADPKSELGLQYSVELCGGTHVDNTGHLGALVITNFLARQAVANGKRLRSKLDRLRQWESTGQKRTLWVEEAQAIEKMVAVLATTKPDMALVLLAPPSDNEKRKIVQGVIYIPQNFSRQITTTEVGAHVQRRR
ncbi:hypothetical protein LSAT2_004171 [Lamellibrachia satsuma]|nr:hypothetical protein LSAT2_004171 [Lamellibrachia satsuma]